VQLLDTAAWYLQSMQTKGVKQVPKIYWTMIGALILWAFFGWLFSFEHSVIFLLCLIYAHVVVHDVHDTGNKGNVEDDQR